MLHTRWAIVGLLITVVYGVGEVAHRHRTAPPKPGRYDHVVWDFTQSTRVADFTEPALWSTLDFTCINNVKRSDLTLPTGTKFAFENCDITVIRKGDKLIAVKASSLHGSTEATVKRIHRIMDLRTYAHDRKRLADWQRGIDREVQRGLKSLQPFVEGDGHTFFYVSHSDWVSQGQPRWATQVQFSLTRRTVLTGRQTLSSTD